MFERFLQSIEISFENFIARVLGSSYKGEWEKQNKELDNLQLARNKEKTEYKNTITKINNELAVLKIKKDKLKKELVKKTEEYKNCEIKKNKEYLDLMKKYQDLKLRLNKIILEKRKLASSKGGLNSKIKRQEEEIKKYKAENTEVKNLLQKIIKESKRKITPATLEELRNYKLFGDKKGKRR